MITVAVTVQFASPDAKSKLELRQAVEATIKSLADANYTLTEYGKGGTKKFAIQIAGWFDTGPGV